MESFNFKCIVESLLFDTGENSYVLLKVKYILKALFVLNKEEFSPPVMNKSLYMKMNRTIFGWIQIIKWKYVDS